MGMFSTKEIWQRSGEGEGTMSANLYALSLAGFTSAGILFAGAMSLLSRNWHIEGWYSLIFILCVMAMGLCGSAVCASSKKPAISLLGYGMVAGPFGLLLGPVVKLYPGANVARAFFLTMAIVLILGIVGAIIPESLKSWGIWLLGALLILIVATLAVPFLGLIGISVHMTLTVIDWVAIVIFSGFVIYDMNKAMHIPPTLDNAIDSAAALFLDVFNIFIRILSLMGGNSSSSK